MSDLINLDPPDMGSLNELKPVTFTVQGGDPVSFVGIWVRYEGSDEEILAYNGTEFLPPFASNSTVLQPLGDDTLLTFSVVPELGWLANVESFRVEGFPVIV